MHLAMASTVEAQTAEEATVCSSESCDRNPVIDLQMQASRNLAVNTEKYQLVSTFDAWPWCSKNETHLHASLA